jgi:MFS family permease
MPTQKLWTRDFVIATASGLFTSMVFYITMTTFAGYAVSTYQANESIAGLTAGVFVIGGALGRLVAARYVELVGRRKMLLISSLLFAVFGLGYLVSAELMFFLCVRLLHGAAFGVLHTALVTVVAGIIPPKRLGEGMGYFSLNFVLATALGPLVGLFIVHQFSYQMLFVVCFAFALCTFFLILWMKVAPPELTEEQMASFRAKHSFADLFAKKALPISGILAIMGLCYTGVTAFIDSYTIELGLASYTSIFFIVYAGLVLLVRPLAGKLLDRRGDNIVMLPTIAFFAIGLLVLGLANSEASIIFAALFMALGYGNFLTAGQVIAANSVPPHKISTATSTFFILSELGQGFGPLVMGLIATASNFATMYLVEAGIVTASILLYYVLHGAHQKSSAAAKH